MSTVLAEELGVDGRHCVLSGPNLAREVVQGMPTSTAVASADRDAAEEAQRLLNSSTFRVYTNTDVIGTEMAGALKNPIAIAAGICDGMGLGDNAKAALTARGLAEITRLGVAAGAQLLTFAGNAGLGDLVATCYSNLSRNHRVGVALAEGRIPDAGGGHRVAGRRGGRGRDDDASSARNGACARDRDADHRDDEPGAIRWRVAAGRRLRADGAGPEARVAVRSGNVSCPAASARRSPRA